MRSEISDFRFSVADCQTLKRERDQTGAIVMKSRFHSIVVALMILPALAAAQAQEPAADPYQALAKWEFGQSRQPLAQIEEQIRKTAPADCKAIEAKLLPVLRSPDTPKDAKRYICRWLAVVGSADCVPAVAELLGDPDLSHPARMALEPLAVPAAAAAPELPGHLAAEPAEQGLFRCLLGLQL